jgi:hypothetical protein
VLLILPSFFTLLVVRTTTVEREATAFGVRQEVIRRERPEQSLVRWLRIVARSLPMSVFLLAVPYLLVYRVFPGRGGRAVTGCLVAYLSLVLLLQSLGTVRAYYSWRDRDAPPLRPPPLFEPPRKAREVSLLCCVVRPDGLCGGGGGGDGPLPTPPPAAPNSFDLRAPGNCLVIASLALEFFQMAFFPLQNDPYATDTAAALHTL